MATALKLAQQLLPIPTDQNRSVIHSRRAFAAPAPATTAVQNAGPSNASVEDNTPSEPTPADSAPLRVYGLIAFAPMLGLI